MSVQTRHSGLSLISLAMEGTTVLAVYMLAMMLAPVPLMIAVRSTSRINRGGAVMSLAGAAARDQATAGAGEAPCCASSQHRMQPDTGKTDATRAHIGASSSPSASELINVQVPTGAAPGSASWPDPLKPLRLLRSQEPALMASRERLAPTPAMEMLPTQAAPPPVPVGGSTSTTKAKGADRWWSWQSRLRARRSAGRLSAEEEAERAQRIDFLSLALATLPSKEDGTSDLSRHSFASSSAVHVSDLGLEQLESAVRQAQIRPKRLAMHHALTVWRAVGGFVGTPSVTRDIFFAWLAWTLMLALKPEVRSLPTAPMIAHQYPPLLLTPSPPHPL